VAELRYMEDLRNDYVFLVNWLARTGSRVESRGLATREQTGVTLVFPAHSRTFLPIGIGRGVNTKLAAIEALQLLSGEARSDLVKLAAPNFEDVLVDPSNRDYGAYGPRIADRLSGVYTLLKRDSTTRRAVATIWEPRDLLHNGDRPCTLSLQFLLRDDRLEMHVTMRSQDVWLGLCYDGFMFTQAQHTLARRLDVEVGTYVHHVGSLHLYESNIESAIARLLTTSKPAPELPTGVVAPDGTTATLVAKRFLTNSASGAERESNPWYQRQIENLYADALRQAHT
jgi:thymidylate synthase